MQKQTTVIKKNETVNKTWFIVDASTAPLGRIATVVSRVLLGKHKPTYSPNLDNGDNVIIINAQKAVLTGNKMNGKLYYTQVSQQPGGLRVRTAKVMQEKYPVEMVRHAVKGMMPKGPLGRKMLKKLVISADADFNKSGIKPIALEIK